MTSWHTVNQKAPGSIAARGFDGGDDGNRTHDILLAKQVLCQLSYVPRRGHDSGLTRSPTRNVSAGFSKRSHVNAEVTAPRPFVFGVTGFVSCLSTQRHSASRSSLAHIRPTQRRGRQIGSLHGAHHDTRRRARRSLR